MAAGIFVYSLGPNQISTALGISVPESASDGAILETSSRDIDAVKSVGDQINNHKIINDNLDRRLVAEDYSSNDSGASTQLELISLDSTDELIEVEIDANVTSEAVAAEFAEDIRNSEKSLEAISKDVALLDYKQNSVIDRSPDPNQNSIPANDNSREYEPVKNNWLDDSDEPEKKSDKSIINESSEIQIAADKTPYDPGDQFALLPAEILSVHNSARSALGQAPLSWSADLAASARVYAQQLSQSCELVHEPGINQGENLYYGWFSKRPDNFDSARPSIAWLAEELDYDYDSNSCAPGKMCGHYTQMIWHDTTQVGCAQVICPDSLAKNELKIIQVCRYAPPGNYIGERPY